MSFETEHHDCAESLAAYALGALPPDESERVHDHLQACRECRAELDWLRAGVDAIPASVPPVAPPPELKDRIMRIVEAEAELLRAAGHAADLPEPARRRAWPRWRGSVIRGLTPGLALAGAGALAVAVVLVLAGGGQSPRTISAQIINPSLRGRVHASLTLRGSRAELVIDRLPAPRPGHVDELWVKRGDHAPQPAGTFVVRSGSVQVGRPVHGGDLVMVTVEPGRGTAQPTTKPVLIARA